MTNQRDRLCTGLLAVLVTATFVFLVFMPRTKEMRRLGSETAWLQNQVTDRAEELEKLTRIRVETQRAKRDLADFDLAVPLNSEVGRFVEDVAALAESHDIRDPQVEPQRPIGAACGEFLPVQLGFEGSFESIMGFLRSVESMTRIARVSRLHLAQSEETPGQLSADMTVLIFYQHSSRGGFVGS